MKEQNKEPIPEEFDSLEEAGEFWDTHSAADYWDEMEDVSLEIDVKDRRFAVLLEDKVYYALERAAATQGVQPDALLNEILRRQLEHS
jgi:hypothetical protein